MTDDDTREEQETEEEAKQTFADFLAMHRAGMLDSDLIDALREVADAVARTGKSGEVKLTLKVTKQPDMVSVLDEIATKVPEIPDAKLYFLDWDGNFTRENPLAGSLDLRSTEGTRD